MGNGKLNAGGSPAMAWHPIQRGVKQPQSLYATETFGKKEACHRQRKKKKNWGGESMLLTRRNGQETLGVAAKHFLAVVRLDTTSKKTA